MLRALPLFSLNESVSMESSTKLVPPAWSVSRNTKKSSEGILAGPVSQLVKFERECDSKMDKLIGDSDEEGDGEVVFIEHVDGPHGYVCTWAFSLDEKFAPGPAMSYILGRFALAYSAPRSSIQVLIKEYKLLRIRLRL